MIKVIGIDPGVNGGLSAFWCCGRGTIGEVICSPIKDNQSLNDFIEDNMLENATGFIEDITGAIRLYAPGNKLIYNLKLCASANFLEGVLVGKQMPVHRVKASTWQKGIRGVKDAKGQQKKKLLKDEACRLFPDQKPTLKTCDALLIGHYGVKFLFNDNR